MKKLLVLAIAVIGVQFTASAQVQEKVKRDTIRSHYKGDRGAKMKEELNLSKEQSEKMKAIHQDIKPRLQAVREDKSLSDADRKAKVSAIMKERKERVDAILNPEQREKMKMWDGKIKEHRKDGGKKHGGHKKDKMKGEKAKEAEKSEQ